LPASSSVNRPGDRPRPRNGRAPRPAELAVDRLERTQQLGLVGDISGDRHGAAAIGGDFGNDRAGRVRPGAVQDGDRAPPRAARRATSAPMPRLPPVITTVPVGGSAGGWLDIDMLIST